MLTINLMNLKKILIKTLGLLLINGLVCPTIWSLTYSLPSNGNVIGSYKKIQAREGDMLHKIAQRYDIGMYEIYTANAHLPRRSGLEAGTTVIIPARFVLPSAPRQGIVLNLAKMRVFVYHPDGDRVSTYPVGVGRQGWSTPQGSTTIVNKKAHPDWHPTASIRREAARRGKTLPTVVLAGPKNPLGQYAMYLGFKGILMHGTNTPKSIGLRSSHGCIRMFPADIEELFNIVRVGTPVRVVYDNSRE